MLDWLPPVSATIGFTQVGSLQGSQPRECVADSCMVTWDPAVCTVVGVDVNNIGYTVVGFNVSNIRYTVVGVNGNNIKCTVVGVDVNDIRFTEIGVNVNDIRFTEVGVNVNVIRFTEVRVNVNVIRFTEVRVNVNVIMFTEQNKLSLLICFRKKCPLLVRYLQLKKMQSIEVKQRISNFFSYNVYFVFQKIGNSQNILRKINFYIKAIKARLPV